MSHDPDVLRYIKDELGPDTFMLRVSGGQRWTSEFPRYLGNCSWRFDVSLSNAGDIWLELWHSYMDYQVFDEDDPSDWIAYNRTALLDQPFQLDLCPSHCKSHPFPRYSLSFLEEVVNNGHPTLPPCGDDTLSGVWLPWHPADQMYPPAFIIPPRKGFSPLMGQYHYLPDGCHLYHAGNQFLQDHSACTVRKNGEKWNVLFLGDSHMRFVLHSWQYRLAGHTDYYPEKEKPEWKKSVVTYNDSSYYFNWSPYAKDWHTAVQAEDMGNIDAIVASYAAWPAMNGVTAAEYTEHLIHGLDVIDQHATFRLKRKVWLTSAPFPPSGPCLIEKNDERMRNLHTGIELRNVFLKNGDG
ncbi:hypothetical protein QFC21_003513 [Naganishia friedmannii]|uniref:Uncharacterized protein n=1 Tax=Naganishia friedmannii TaxID=89922 RepID=A0ACC2VMW2_9TREE|nr:hypothetical protein QFC21_003513 [Naganishia friedmannii]